MDNLLAYLGTYVMYPFQHWWVMTTTIDSSSFQTLFLFGGQIFTIELLRTHHRLKLFLPPAASVCLTTLKSVAFQPFSLSQLPTNANKLWAVTCQAGSSSPSAWLPFYATKVAEKPRGDCRFAPRKRLLCVPQTK